MSHVWSLCQWPLCWVTWSTTPDWLGQMQRRNRGVQGGETHAWCEASQPAPGKSRTGTSAVVGTGTLLGPGRRAVIFVQCCSGVNLAWLCMSHLHQAYCINAATSLSA